LRPQRCTKCGAWRHHPRLLCPACRSFDYTGHLASGRGVVHTFTIVHRPTLLAFVAQLPYNVIVVRLEEGPFMVSNLIDYRRRSAHRPAGGGDVRAVDDDIALPVPAAAGCMMSTCGSWRSCRHRAGARRRRRGARERRVDYQAMVNAVVKGTISGRAQPPSSEEIAKLSDAALESLIDLELLYGAAQKQGITVPDAQVDAEIARNRARFPNAADYDAALARSGMTPATLRADTRKTLVVKAFLENVVWKEIFLPPDAAAQVLRPARGRAGGKSPSKRSSR
jgi:uncharacterized OB-fold protein